MFSSRYRYLCILLLGMYSYLNTLFTEVKTYYGFAIPGYILMLIMVLIVLVIWEGNRLLLKVIKHRLENYGQIKFLFIFFILGVLLAVVNTIVVCFFIGKWMRLPEAQTIIGLKLAFTFGTRINLFLHILNAIFVYITEYKNKQLEAEELKRINAQSQLQAIKNQVNPHFLFNNLNVLSGMVVKDNPDANKFIEAFSKVYRHILNSQDKELVTIENELEVITPYIFLLQKRFPESVQVDIEIDPIYFNHFIVPAALQMLIENAIKHNVLSRANPLKILISINKNGGLFVRNNLQPKQQLETSTQVGLRNIEQRYGFIIGKKINVIKDPDSFTVILPLIQQPL